MPKRAILKLQAPPTWRLDYYVIIEFLNELSLIRTDVSQSGLAAARIDNWTVQWTVHGPFGCWTHWADVRLLLKHMVDVDTTDDDG